MTTKTSGGLRPQQKRTFPLPVILTQSQDGFHWVDLGYTTILSQPLTLAGFTLLAGVVAPARKQQCCHERLGAWVLCRAASHILCGQGSAGAVELSDPKLLL